MRRADRNWRRRLVLAVVAAGVTLSPSVAGARAQSDVLQAPIGGGSFATALPGLTDLNRAQFARGRRLFRLNFAVAPASRARMAGLGPLYNRESCAGCHVRGGRGRPPVAGEVRLKSMVVRLSQPDAGQARRGHPIYGAQIQDKGILGVPQEGRITIHYDELSGRFPDGIGYRLRMPRYGVTHLAHGPLGVPTRLSGRVAPAVAGLGLLEAVDEAIVIAWADPDDADGDGISGRPNWVPEPATGRRTLGRFGWKAQGSVLPAQVAAAFNLDMGITSSLLPRHMCTPAQSACRKAAGNGPPELSDRQLADVLAYLRHLAPPPRRHQTVPAVRSGADLFRRAGCAACHRPTLRVAADVTLGPRGGRYIAPYTDLLLHDMGAGLADGQQMHQAGGREWRTAPLWGLGAVPRVNGHSYYLHDGRARSVLEAILWHDGEARGARDAVRAMTATERDDLLWFLDSL